MTNVDRVSLVTSCQSAIVECYTVTKKNSRSCSAETLVKIVLTVQKVIIACSTCIYDVIFILA